MHDLPPLILASKSPRRQELLRSMGFDFRVVLRDVDESYDTNLAPASVATFISEKKARAFDEGLQGEIVITADTIVCIDNQILGKPEDAEHAFRMLSQLSGRKHEVITGVSMLKDHRIRSFYDISEVYFTVLTESQINYYISTGMPMDKAGSYGIQEWIGLIGIEKINGSYTNVVGLPTEKLYKELVALV
ncbi:MAG TPA: Maf family nucleotide pyrophosphatase [Sphingobacteriaceae bacterium]